MDSTTQAPASSSAAAQISQTGHPSPQKCQDHFELGVALSLFFWPALTLAVQNNWGNGDSSDLRDWFGGQIVGLFDADPETEMVDVETRLLNIMEDEFQVIVDDESAFEVAEQIMRLRRDCAKGSFAEVTALREKWQRQGGKDIKVKMVDKGEEDAETDGDSSFSDESEYEDDDGDAEMTEAPLSTAKAAPEVDEDGFTKVVGKKKR